MTETIQADTKQLLALAPILFVADVTQTVRYYQETLGFQKDWDYGDPVFYASVSRDGITIHFRHLDMPPTLSGRIADIVDLYVTVGDVDRLYSEQVGRGARVIYGPVKQEYGMKEFYVEDCNGYRLAFGQAI